MPHYLQGFIHPDGGFLAGFLNHQRYVINSFFKEKNSEARRGEMLFFSTHIFHDETKSRLKPALKRT